MYKLKGLINSIWWRELKNKQIIFVKNFKKPPPTGSRIEPRCSK